MNSIIALSIFGIVSLFLGFLGNRKVLMPLTLVFILVAFGLNLADWNQQALWFFGMLRTENSTINFSSIILLSVLLVVAISRNFGDDDEHTHPAEYYAIMMFASAGALLMTNFENMIMLFVGLEILSVSLYVLTGTDKRSTRSNEAALKYFLMGAFATGILLFGVALLYGATGSFTLAGIGGFVSQTQVTNLPTMLFIGMMLLLIGLFFKVSIVPFHFWTPDVYDGAPSLFTAFMSTVVKTAGFAAIYRIIEVCFFNVYGAWGNAAVWLCMITLVIANLGAVYQQSFKRMMAYSSISHAGYLLMAVVARTENTESALMYYSLAYSIATVAAFAVMILVSEAQLKDGRPNESFESFKGLAQNNPLLAFVLTISMLSLAGIPLTAGFWGKFFVFTTAFERGNVMITLAIVAVLASAVGIYYYFKAIMAAYFREGKIPAIEIPLIYKIVLIFCSLSTIVLGVYPSIVKNIF
jgi:NADH-quinone oxidoreductase subunit N